MKNIIIYAPPLLFLIGFFALDESWGCATGGPFFTCFTYVFVHKATLHLGINLLSYVSLSRMIGRLLPERGVTYLAVAYTAAVFAGGVSQQSIPAVGASGISYGYIGIFYAIVTFHDKVKIKRPAFFGIFSVGVFVSLLVSYFKPTSAFDIHIISLLAGFALTGIGLLQKQCKNNAQIK